MRACNAMARAARSARTRAACGAAGSAGRRSGWMGRRRGGRKCGWMPHGTTTQCGCAKNCAAHR